MFVRSLPLARTSGFTKSTLIGNGLTGESFTDSGFRGALFLFQEVIGENDEVLVPRSKQPATYLEAQYTDMVGGP